MFEKKCYTFSVEKNVKFENIFKFTWTWFLNFISYMNFFETNPWMSFFINQIPKKSYANKHPRIYKSGCISKKKERRP